MSTIINTTVSSQYGAIATSAKADATLEAATFRLAITLTSTGLTLYDGRKITVIYALSGINTTAANAAATLTNGTRVDCILGSNIVKTVYSDPMLNSNSYLYVWVEVPEPFSSKTTDTITVKVDTEATVVSVVGAAPIMVLQGTQPAPGDPTKPALRYPNGGGTLKQWDVVGQSWV